MMNTYSVLNKDALVCFLCWARAPMNHELHLSVELNHWNQVSGPFPQWSSFLPGNSHITMRRSMWVGGGREDIEEVIPISLNFILSFMASELSLTLKNKPLVSQVLKNTFCKWFAFSHFFFGKCKLLESKGNNQKTYLVIEKWYYYRKTYESKGVLRWTVVCISG